MHPSQSVKTILKHYLIQKKNKEEQPQASTSRQIPRPNSITYRPSYLSPYINVEDITRNLPAKSMTIESSLIPLEDPNKLKTLIEISSESRNSLSALKNSYHTIISDSLKIIEQSNNALKFMEEWNIEDFDVRSLHNQDYILQYKNNFSKIIDNSIKLKDDITHDVNKIYTIFNNLNLSTNQLQSYQNNLNSLLNTKKLKEYLKPLHEIQSIYRQEFYKILRENHLCVNAEQIIQTFTGESLNNEQTEKVKKLCKLFKAVGISFHEETKKINVRESWMNLIHSTIEDLLTAYDLTINNHDVSSIIYEVKSKINYIISTQIISAGLSVFNNKVIIDRDKSPFSGYINITSDEKLSIFIADGATKKMQTYTLSAEILIKDHEKPESFILFFWDGNVISDIDDFLSRLQKKSLEICTGALYFYNKINKPKD